MTARPAGSGSSGTAGGDLTGTYPNPTVKSSVALSGNPTAATQTAGNSTTRLATTAFVQAAFTASSTDWYNVKDAAYGATGDGTTDDTTAIQAAITAAKASSTRAAAVFFPGGEYKITATLDISGCALIGAVRAPGTNAGLVILRHNFNGDLIKITGAAGGLLRNLYLYQHNSTAYTGSAVYGLSTLASNVGEVVLENVTISGGGGWERDLYFDGSANAIGIRKIRVVNCELFGCTTAGETVVIKKGIHVSFVGVDIVPAPTAVTQGIKIFDNLTDSMEFVACDINGNFYTESQGRMDFTGGISGTITCHSTSQKAAFRGRLGTIADSGTDNSFLKSPTPRAAVSRGLVDQSIPDSATTTISWLTEEEDTDTMVTAPSPSTDRITIQTPGEYVVTLTGAFTSNSTGLRNMAILKNGGIAALHQMPAATAGETCFSLSRRFHCATADYIQASCLQASGGALALKGYGADSYSVTLEAVKVG